MADAPSGLTPQSFAPSLTIFQMISSNLHVDPYTYNVFIWKRISYFWCSFSAFNHFFSSVHCFNSCKMVPPHSFQIFFNANSFEKLLQDFCPFCIFFICLHFLYQYTFWNFLIYHLGVRIPVPDKWVFLGSSLCTIWQNITKRNLHYFFSLYNFYNSTLLL